MAAAPSSSNSLTNTPVVKQDTPQVVSSEIKDSKETKKVPIEEPIEESVDEILEIMDREHAERFKRYEAEYRQHMLAKYFSDMASYGGDKLFETRTIIGGHTILASRVPPYEAIADPAFFDELIRKDSSSSEETPTTGASNKKPSTSASNKKPSA